MHVLEGPILLADCLSDDKRCERSCACPTKVVWQRLSKSMDDVLYSVTLQDMPGHKLCRDYEDVKNWLLAEHPSREALHESAARTVQRYNWKPCADAFLSIAAGEKQ